MSDEVTKDEPSAPVEGEAQAQADTAEAVSEPVETSPASDEQTEEDPKVEPDETPVASDTGTASGEGTSVDQEEQPKEQGTIEEEQPAPAEAPEEGLKAEEDEEHKLGKQQVEEAFAEDAEPMVDVGVARMEDAPGEERKENVEMGGEEDQPRSPPAHDDVDDEKLLELRPGTPELEENTQEGESVQVDIDAMGLRAEEDEEEAIPVQEVNREEIIEKYMEDYNNYSKLLQTNAGLQHRIAEYFHRQRQTEDQDELTRRAMADHEQRYAKCMNLLETTQNNLLELTAAYERDIAEAIEEVKHRQKAVEEHWKSYVSVRTDTAFRSVSFRTGKLMQQKELDELHVAEQRKEEELQKIRLAHIRMRNKLKKQEAQLKEEEKLGDGGDLHVIDFEQLKIENQTYSEKIEERNDEVIKMRKKIESSLQMLAHVKEKLAFIQEGNTFHAEELKSVEEHVKERRNRLNHVKHIRDALRFENTRLRQQSGLLGREPLLRDFEEKQDRAAALRQRIEDLRQQQNDLTAQCKVVRQKVEESHGVSTTATFA